MRWPPVSPTSCCQRPRWRDKLVELWQNAQQIELPDPPDDLRVGAAARLRERDAALRAFQDVMALLLDATGHDFRRYKRATVLRRLERRMQVCRKATLPAYLRYLQLNPPEARLLLQDMLISVTNFFRDPEAFDALEGVVAAVIGSPREPSGHVRAWVAGCATGEEAYSVAMVLHRAGAGDERPAAGAGLRDRCRRTGHHDRARRPLCRFDQCRRAAAAG